MNKVLNWHVGIDWKVDVVLAFIGLQMHLLKKLVNEGLNTFHGCSSTLNKKQNKICKDDDRNPYIYRFFALADHSEMVYKLPIEGILEYVFVVLGQREIGQSPIFGLKRKSIQNGRLRGQILKLLGGRGFVKK